MKDISYKMIGLFEKNHHSVLAIIRHKVGSSSKEA